MGTAWRTLFIAQGWGWTVGRCCTMSASGGAAAPIANARFVAAIISGGAMPVQVRMTGPANTVSDAEKDFDQMIKSMTLK